MKNNFVFLGDSLTFGYGVSKKDCWVTLFENNTNLNVINKGINGSTTTDMLVRFDKDVLTFTPDKTFIMGGTNDLLSNRALSSILSNIELMIKDLKSINSSIIVGIPPDIIVEDAYRLFMPSSTYDYCKKLLPTLREKLITLCTNYDCDYVDFYSLTKNNIQNNIYIDGIHLNSKGQQLMLNEFLNRVVHEAHS